MKYYIIAGEMSGDVHAAYLIKELKCADSAAEFRFWGGDNMIAQTDKNAVVKHIKDLAFMGFVEVAANIGTVLKNISLCKKDMLAWLPDAVILIDYPGFNLRMAKFAHRNGLKVFYYISPQVWAWKSGRIKSMKKNIDKLFVILPFEKEFYKRHDMDVEFFGHPLIDEIDEYESQSGLTNNLTRNLCAEERPLIALLPGSRKQEVKKIIPLYAEIADKFKQLDFAVAAVNTLDKELYRPMEGKKNVKVIFNQTYQIFNKSWAALVASGTATLETALFDIPQIVCYKTNPLSYWIAKNLAHVKWISLVNIILNKYAIEELLQKNFNKEKIEEGLRKIVYNEDYRKYVRMVYSELRDKLGNKGASEKVAKRIVAYMNDKQTDI